jgi:DNA topoisomerase IA
MPTIDVAAVATVLAVGLLLVGVMGIHAAIATRAHGRIRWDVVIVNAVYLLFAYVLSAGRVQCVSRRLIIGREREIEAFVPEE